MRAVRSTLGMFGLITFVMAVAAGAQTPPAQAPAGGQPPPPPMTNLQVYPKDIPRPQLVTTMQGFVAALGVQQSGGCGYCHAGTAPQFDWASDSNPKKVVARKM